MATHIYNRIRSERGSSSGIYDRLCSDRADRPKSGFLRKTVRLHPNRYSRRISVLS